MALISLSAFPKDFKIKPTYFYGVIIGVLNLKYLAMILNVNCQTNITAPINTTSSGIQTQYIVLKILIK